MSSRFLPYGRQLIEDDDVAEVARVLRSDMLTTGPEVPALEAAFAAAVGAKHAVASNSGTAALHLAAMAVGLGPGMAAIVPSVTFLATANAVRLTGAEVVFADVDPGTGLMTRDTLDEALARAALPVRAVLPVHLGGQTVDLPAIAARSCEQGAVLIEDACHALGTCHGTRGAENRVGACAHSVAATFSLHPVKTIAAGEGGVTTTNDAALAERMMRARNHGLTREAPQFANRDLAFAADGGANPWYYEMADVGLNYRLNDFQAALARNQLAKLPRFANVRKRVAARYDVLLAGRHPLVRTVPRAANCDPVLHLYQVLVDFEAAGIDRATLMARLKAQGIGTQVHYIPVHRQPYYAARYPETRLPGADAFYARTLSLPLYAAMEEADADRVAAALIEALPRA